MPEFGTKIDEEGRVVPDLKVIGKRIYQGGTPVQEWQLTPNELRQVYPERYRQVYGEEPMECPVPGCDKQNFIDKRAWLAHGRLKHPQFLADNRAMIEEAANLRAIVEQLKASPSD